jgi:myo-inositol-1(or 4)-monophosphatase
MLTSKSSHLLEYLDFAAETVYLAGRLTLGYYQTGVRPDMKSDHTPVTVADRLSEELIRSRIERCYPNHAILGEELGENTPVNASMRWVIDPIDGTKSFVRGVPLYAVLLGLEIEGTVEVGAAYFPALDEMLAAGTGLGCWWNGRRAHVSPITDLAQATVCYTDLTKFAQYGRQEAWERLQRTCGLLAGWSDAYGYLLAATGRIEIMLDPIMAVWDCGPWPPILAEAGGYFGDWLGNMTIYGQEGLATSHELLSQVLDILH